MIQAVKWVGGSDGVLELIDQRQLPAKLVKLRVRSVEQLHEAIKTLAVRGAPAIGVAAAYGPVLALQWLTGRKSLADATDQVMRACDYLASSRPTAVNLFWALDLVRQRAQEIGSDPQATASLLQESLFARANEIYDQDVEMCQQIGLHGEPLIRDGSSILTHCNAGALATAGQGTALSVLYEARKQGKRFEVYADETRPLLQGSRLTAWELQQADIRVTVVCDDAAGWLMKQEKIHAVLVGADRIAANGDTANKIGTYGLSVLAKQHGIPFYVAAPSTTFDLSIETGAGIPIEQRDPEEMAHCGEVRTAPAGVLVYNPAFDITEAQNITAIITDKGVVQRPDADRIRKLLTEASGVDA